MNRIKVLTVSLAADEAGHSEIPYPIMHALVYYLSHGSLRLSFPGYIFSTEIHPRFGVFNAEEEDITYPASIELSEDLDRLTAEGLIEQIPGSVKYSVGEEALKQKPNFLRAFAQLEPQVSYEHLTQETRSALSDLRTLISRCYDLYLRL